MLASVRAWRHWAGACAITAVTSACGDDVPDGVTTGGDDLPDGTGAVNASTGSTTGLPSTGGPNSGSADSGDSGEDTEAAPDPRLAITADWQAGTLTLVDVEALAAGATSYDDVLVDTVDLSAYPPGPLEVEVTPDGATAIVAVSPGFFDGLVGNLIGAGEVELDGALLLVDIASRSVTAELQPADVPMGIAISPDGATAYTANYGTSETAGTTMTVVDLAAGAIVEDIEVGTRPEQVSLSTDGSLGIINLAADGSIRVFETSDPAGTLSTPLETSDDPSDVDFIAGTDFAIVANSQTPAVYTVIDVSDPAMPTIVEEGPPPGGFLYVATPIPDTQDVIVTATDFVATTILRVSVAQMPTEVVWRVDRAATTSFPLGAAVAEDLGIVLTVAPGANLLLVHGLDDGAEVTAVPWLDPISPTYVALQPGR